ncbi:hypothetical protein L198_00055 [Cryptococcus wingfieldii CBS 7118]|uniref:GST N-terminal domain-containing protein n=1 Tax=Cryptococcus wingfieldii CBS 7118 TaxID=1295528 RepID=A0A1E3K5J5_9TREE|nr:hypothetical protein L198_00055 [Cryptococcus wingfieldii CBS 7118]ODO08331.1 hypothetical protein L198_00055 [Cryptococcus wingfieldii CBS 7118]
MASSIDPELELFGLVTKSQDPSPNFSPFVWITKVDLAILGVSYKTNNKSFYEIRNDLAELVGDPEVSVPTLKVGDTYLQDSFNIALWLDEKYGKNNTLFGPSQNTKAHTKFLEQWVLWTLAVPIQALNRSMMYFRLDPDSAAYYLRSRYNNDIPTLERRVKEVSEPSYIASQWALLRSHLKPLNILLGEHEAKGKRLFFDGEGPTHADAAVFGWYAFTRENEGWREGWESEEIGYVKKWLGNMIELVGGEKELPGR